MADILYFAPTIQGSGDGLSWASAKALTAAAFSAALAEVGPGGRVYLRANAGDEYLIAAALPVTAGGTESAPVIVQMQQSDGRAPHATAWMTGMRGPWEAPESLEDVSGVNDTVVASMFSLNAGAHWVTFNFIRMRHVSNFAFQVAHSAIGITINDFYGYSVRRLLWDTFPVHRLSINRANVLGFSASFVRFDKPASSDIVILGPSVWDSRCQVNDSIQQPRALSLNAGRRIWVEGITGYRGRFSAGTVRAEGMYIEQDVVDLTVKNCAMHGFSASGFTITFNGSKTYENLTATDNARNFVFGGSASGKLPGLVSRSPNLRGNTAPERHLDVSGNNALIDISGAVFEGPHLLVQYGYSGTDTGYAVHYLDGFTQGAVGGTRRVGSAAQTLLPLTQAATGRRQMRATGGEVLEFVQAFDGGLTIRGQRAQPAFVIMQEAYSGAVPANPRFGSATQNIPPLGRSSEVITIIETPVFGAAAHTLPAPTQTATGGPRVSGNRAQPAFALTQSASAKAIIAGLGAQTLAVTQAATGGAPLTASSGAAAQTLPAFPQAAVGDVDPRFTGAQTIAALGGTRTGAVRVSGNRAQPAFAITQTATGGPVGVPALAQTIIPVQTVNRLSTGMAGSYTTASFTPAANSLLVAVINVTDALSQGVGLNSVTDNRGLTWTKRLANFDQQTVCEVWTAPVLTSQAMTMTVDHPSTQKVQWSVQIFNYTGYNMADPIGAALINAPPVNDGAFTLTMPATPDTGSYVLAGRTQSAAANQTTAATPGAGWTEACDTSSSTATAGAGGLEVQYRTGSASTSAPWVDLNVNTTTDRGTVAFVIEIKKATVAVDAPTGTIWPTQVDAVGHSREIPVAWGSYAAGPSGYATWRPALARKPYSLTAPSKTQVNLEVRSGDLYSEPEWTDPTTSERGEMQNLVQPLVNQTFSLEWWDLLNGATNTAPWCVLAQMFATGAGGSPPIAMGQESGNNLVFITRTDATGTVVETYRHTIVNHPRDTWTKFKIEGRFSRTGTGIFRLWINDVQTINLSNINVGYLGQTSWEVTLSIYRSEAAETLRHSIDSPVLTIT